MTPTPHARFHLSVLPVRLSICRLGPEATAPVWVLEAPFWAVTRTGEELSVVCPEEVVPADIRCLPGWRALKVAGPLDFGLTGVLAGLATPLAEAGISIFALSTFDTDYILIQASSLGAAVQALQQAGHTVEPNTEHD